MTRTIMTSDEIREFLLAEIEKHNDCIKSYFGGIYWQAPDKTGCNWQVSAVEGNDWSKCIERIMPAIQRLREDYNIPDPDSK